MPRAAQVRDQATAHESHHRIRATASGSTTPRKTARVRSIRSRTTRARYAATMNDDDGKIGNVRDLDAGTSPARSRPIDTQAQARAPHAQRKRRIHSLYVRFAP